MNINNLSKVKGKVVTISKGRYTGRKYWVEGLWHELTGFQWFNGSNNPACLKYSLRVTKEGLPFESDNVLYGKLQEADGEFLFGELIHISEVDDTTTEERIYN